MSNLARSVPILTDVVFGLTLARGGSKGLPGKNVKPLGGHPLVAWAVACGRSAKTVHRVICSTDDEKIAAAAAAAGADVPFRRPAEFAEDSSTDLDVFTHALAWLAEHEGSVPEFLVQLRPTTPFREPAWIDSAIGTMRADRSVTCVRTVAPAPITPYKMWKLSEDGGLLPLLRLEGVKEPFNMPRQKLPPVYWHTGQLDVVRAETLLSGSMTGSKIQALVVDAGMAVDIDGPIDFQLAELAFKEKMPRKMIDFLESRAA